VDEVADEELVADFLDEAEEAAVEEQEINLAQNLHIFSFRVYLSCFTWFYFFALLTYEKNSRFGIQLFLSDRLIHPC
jgi:hypothetical protein